MTHPHQASPGVSGLRPPRAKVYHGVHETLLDLCILPGLIFIPWVCSYIYSRVFVKGLGLDRVALCDLSAFCMHFQFHMHLRWDSASLICVCLSLQRTFLPQTFRGSRFTSKNNNIVPAFMRVTPSEGRQKIKNQKEQ